MSPTFSCPGLSRTVREVLSQAGQVREQGGRSACFWGEKGWTEKLKGTWDFGLGYQGQLGQRERKAWLAGRSSVSE